jgi:Arf-GAP/coiled-coil/ANK repeat/PH domain-containing protein
LSYINACSTYYHQGTDLCEDYTTFFKDLDEEVNQMRDDIVQLEKKLQNRHAFVNEFSEAGNASAPKLENRRDSKPPPNYMEGYLFKKTSNAFKTWNRRWFYMQDNKLFYRKRSGDELPSIMEENLKICKVKPVLDSDRRFCFEVISPLK